MKTKKHLSWFLVMLLLVSCLSACGKKDTDEAPDAELQGQPAEETTGTTVPDTENYIELALNVYYNDEQTSYYSNESGESIFVTEDGQYSLTFDCSKDLSSAAVNAGVNSLTNLTAVYILDMGSVNGKQSPLKACSITYDSVVVDGQELTVTKPGPKSAFKSSGVFDTNDPINGWDGSAVEEVVMDSTKHVANFSTVENPTTITVTFTLSGMNWEEAVSADTSSNGEIEPNTYKNPAVFSDMDFTNMTAVELTRLLGNGINLGNTMEAHDNAKATTLDVSTYETQWGQPVTTAEMIQGMKDCGFDTLRIPVAWTNMMDYRNGDYTIDAAYLDRVEEIVNYALDAEMFVIINDHWDGGWWAMFGSNTPQTADSAWQMYEAMWTQIAERFADYSDMVIFESANEELGDGLNNNTNWSDSGKLSEDETYEVTNAINQKFVDIVRASGGNNDDRFLLIAGYNTNIDLTCDERYKMPNDTADKKLFISVHYYDPWNYCGDKKDDSTDTLVSYRWGLAKEYEYMSAQLGKMSKFTDAGYGVIIGEYGALPAYINNRSYEIPNTIEYTENLLNVCAVNNFCPVLWDCNGIYNKAARNMISSGLNELFTSHCYAEEAAAGDGYLDDVKARMQEAADAAPEMWDGVVTYEPGTPVAWIMWNGGAGTYSVGDTYNPADNTVGITAHDVVVDGAGEYTVSLEFAGTNDGITFAALGLADGELLYPNAIIDIKEILIDGEPANLVADPYTSSDNGACTRVNLYNAWVKKLPDDARNASGDLSNAAPVILDAGELVGIKEISITFELLVE